MEYLEIPEKEPRKVWGSWEVVSENTLCVLRSFFHLPGTKHHKPSTGGTAGSSGFDVVSLRCPFQQFRWKAGTQLLWRMAKAEVTLSEEQ